MDPGRAGQVMQCWRFKTAGEGGLGEKRKKERKERKAGVGGEEEEPHRGGQGTP